MDSSQPAQIVTEWERVTAHFGGPQGRAMPVANELGTVLRTGNVLANDPASGAYRLWQQKLRGGLRG